MSVADILRGQILALRRQFLLPMITVLVIETVFLFAAMRENGKDVEGMTLFVSIWVAYMIMLAADLPALSVVAMWVSLTTKNPNRTTGITLTRLLVLPTVIWVATMMLYTFFRYATSSQGPGWQLLLGLYFGLGMAADLFFGINAWRQLRANFREVAVQRFAQGPSIFRRLFGRRKPAAEIPPPLVIPS
jgi:hypothetical protein